MQIFTPSGHITRYNLTMLLYQWALVLKEEGLPVIVAGIGKPTYPLNLDYVEAEKQYWDNLFNKVKLAKSFIDENDMTEEERSNCIADQDAVIDYGDPQGDLECRKSMGEYLTKFFNQKVTVTAENILFTVGGSSALYNLFKVLNNRKPDAKIITPVPYYPLYKGPDNINQLYTIDVMECPGYKLTAPLLETSLKKAKQTSSSALLLCNPNNPLGTVFDENDWQEFAKILRKFSDISIILDEVYSEMSFHDKPFISLLEIAPDLKDRTILLRSATKALSAPGERIACIAAFNKDLIHDLVVENIKTTSHAPRSGQYAFSKAMHTINLNEVEKIKNFYEPQVRYVEQRLNAMGAAMPDTSYKVQGGFYVLANLSKLRGMTIPKSASRAINCEDKAKTDYDIAFALLFSKHIMLAPLSQCGISSDKCYFRITCSAGLSKLKVLMDRIEDALNKCSS